MQTEDARQITSAGTGLRVIGSLTANVTDNIFHVNTLLFGNVGKDVMLIASDNIKPDIRVTTEVVAARQVAQTGLIFNVEFFHDSLLIRHDENQSLFSTGKVLVDNVGVLWLNET
ncbi:MAG: hypothetical protein CMJ50_00030 [Planctomycetaceae bacterium]|nr:hypothetical protein [Planctomycetaceae bacterium]